jgi:thioredoxin reductase (NADPH)
MGHYFIIFISLTIATFTNICSETTVPILIIGSGPAGLMAGVYAGRAKIPTFIISGHEVGGQLMGAPEVENMPGIIRNSGFDIMHTLQQQALSFGAQIIEDVVIQVNFNEWPFIVTLQNHGALHALSVIIATGATPRRLHVPGENEYWGKGISACSICDCFLFKDKNVAIVGGGDAAVDHALNLVPYASHITLFVRRDQMRAAPSVQERILNHEKISIRFNKEITQILGDGESVTALKIKDGISQQEQVEPFDGLFLAIGHDPATTLFKDQLVLSKTGYIVLDSRSQATSVKGIFAAGDVADDKFRQAGIAAGTGIQAALEAIEFLREKGLDHRSLKTLSLAQYSHRAT